MKNFSKVFSLIVALAALVIMTRAALAVNPNTLVKGSGPAVYYITSDNVRHAFPNQVTFDSWFPRGARINKLNDAQLSIIPQGPDVTLKPGVYLALLPGESKVYVVSRYGVLRWVPSLELVKAYYGQNWSKKLTIIPQAFVGDYTVGSRVTSVSSYSISYELSSVKTIQDNMRKQTSVSPSDGWMTADQKRRAEQITSVFESGTPEFDYAVVVYLDDGRGYTSGRIGFTTATGDAYTAVERYTKKVTNNPLAKYLARLNQLSDDEDGSVAGLEGFPEAWAQAAKDPIFREIQDRISDEVYYAPAMKAADSMGIKTALARAVLYDTMIQHGGGNTQDSFNAIVQRANNAAGGIPKNGVEEKIWLNAFLQARKQTLLNAYNPDTRIAWAESAGRVDVLKNLADTENFDLHGPFVLRSPEYNATIN